ncbi:ATP synthase F1 subunit epsilon [Candidatus Gottesmanbacteria bacterium RIFCSPHIGHO2_02_FULL_39_14]|uniref:ATP synthase epsilon chain n=2 Tax=Candidatus Gottesmaniibacteriota TaxID=1752720 RepID=A0A1F6A423_9BACT|nr:MAG: ATP synthase F1 subunit epsilon [Candidatus Gottesmanbacteria bacterium RIFCSPHIGHO2_02_FULL_39_14]OGG31636.1 MAG: ATP synthase F1 subunit epsilon [Candidatus Gottesmanbacteria bacterium RIFCSPLOWO2_02_FULL_38_8]
MKNIHLEIITPERIAFSGDVYMISAPSSTGRIGILPGHIPLFTRLIEGEVKITKTTDVSYLAIGSGFLQIAKDKAVILVTSAYHADEINEAEVLEAKKRAEEALRNKPRGEALIAAQSQFLRSQIALKVLRRRKSRLSSMAS